MIQNTQTGMASVAGASLYYELTGEGPTLVLAHANPADHTMWDDQMDALSAHYRVLRYDQRGVGQSEGAAGPFSHHEDLNWLLETLGTEQAHFIGLSNGSMVVTDFALSYPDKVLSLVLASPAVSGFESRLRRSWPYGQPLVKAIWRTPPRLQPESGPTGHHEPPNRSTLASGVGSNEWCGKN